MNFKLRVLIGAVLAAAAVTAHAQNFSFSCISNNKAADCATGQAQFSLTVSGGGGTVNFLFENSGPNASSITDIYFDWAGSTYALTPGTLTDSGAGVSFSWGATPPSLPAGNGISFTADLGVDSNPPRQPMGVNPGEWLNIAFAANANLVEGLSTGDLRVGIHTQGYEGGGSESLVLSAVPEPETYALLIAGFGLMIFVARRRRQNLAA